MRITTTVIALTVWALCTIPALANVNRDTPVHAYILPQADSPVMIRNCSALANDFVSTYSSPPQYLYTQVHAEFTFENTSPSDISAVRFGFEVDDSFNHPYGTFSGTVQVDFRHYILGGSRQKNHACPPSSRRISY